MKLEILFVPQEKRCPDCNHYGKFSLDCARCDYDCSMFEPKESKEGRSVINNENEKT